MNRLAEGIARVCREHPLAEKILLCPNLRVGHQWMEVVARNGQPVVNVRPQTMKGLALTLAGPEMAENKLRFLSRRGMEILVEVLWTPRKRKDPSGGYFSSLQGLLPLTPLLAATLADLRLAGMDPGSLGRRDFEVAAKGDEIRDLLTGYLEELERHRLIDYAQALATAARRLAEDSEALPSGCFVLVPRDLDLAHLEEALLAAIPGDRRKLLEVDEGGLAAALAGKEARLFPAVGEVNEVRETFRRLLAEGIPLDQAEILYTDGETYIPLLYEEAARLLADCEADDCQVPVTFEERLPTRYSRPGRALAAWTSWIRQDFPQAVLVRMVQDGLLQVPGMDEEKVSFLALADVLRSLPIGFGRERYGEKLDAALAAIEKRLRRSGSFPDEEGEVGALDSEALARKGERLHLLKHLVQILLVLSPDPGERDPRTILQAALRFLREAVRFRNKMDEYAGKLFREEIEDLASWVPLGGDHLDWDTLDWLSSLPREERVAGSGPLPGALHATSLAKGGHSGRPHTFILGLDDSRFPGNGRPDPVLLDPERTRLSLRLPTAAGRLRKKTDDFIRLLGRLRGRVTLSYCSRSLEEDREMFPSPVVLAVHRILTGRPEADQKDLDLALKAHLASFAPEDPALSLDEDEWWISRLCGEKTLAGAENLVSIRFPHLARGLTAERERAREDVFTGFDGLVPHPGEDLDPFSPAGPVLSPSRLQDMGACPLRFYLRHVLGAEPPEEVQRKDRAEWLDPAQFGSLLHEVLGDFVAGVVRDGPDRDREAAKARMAAILQRKEAKYRDLYPPPGEQAREDQMEILRKATGNFLSDEWSTFRTRPPLAVELSVGIPGGPDPDPVPVPLPGGRSFRTRGRIDRVDLGMEDGRPALFITDYKSGSSRLYELDRDDPTRGGRNLQPFIYRALARASSFLRDKTGDLPVASFRYYFPASRRHSATEQWTEKDMDAAALVVERLCAMLRGGVFPGTNDAQDCRYCDFNGTVCCEVGIQARTMGKKVGNSGNPALRPYRVLRGMDGGDAPEED